MSHKEHASKCCLIFSLICFICLTIGGFILCFHTLVPSIDKAKAYKETNCFVESNFVDILCGDENSECTSYNDQVFWYNSWGFYYVGYYGGGYPTDYSGGSDDDSDNGNDSNGSNDGSESDDDGESGASGGASGGGDDGGGFDDMVAIDNLVQSTSGGAAGDREVREFSRRQRKSKANSGRKLQEQLSSNSSYSSSGEQCYGSYYNCYEANQNVSYSDVNGNQYFATVFGYWTDDLSWTDDYSQQFSTNNSYTCYYNSNDNQYVMWFKPPAYDKSAMTGTVILFVLAFVFLIITIVLAVKTKVHHHFHHISSHGSQHNGYTVIQNQPVYQAQQPQAHQPPMVYQAQQPQPYYTYNNGIPSAPNPNFK